MKSLDTKKNCDPASRCLKSGAPHILLTGNGRQFCNRVEEDLNATWPVLKIVLGKSLTSVKRVNDDTDNKITSKKQENDTSNSSVGLKFFQLMKNHTCCLGIKRLPNKTTFRTTSEVDILTTSCLKMLQTPWLMNRALK